MFNMTRDKQKEKISRALTTLLQEHPCRFDVAIGDGLARIVLDVTQIPPERHADIKDKCTQVAVTVEGITKADVILTAEREAAPPARAKPLAPKNPIPGVKRVVLIGSGKGGVGKSTVTVNLAVAAARQGLKVGILDADIYGPSIHHMLSLDGQPKSPDGTQIYPIENHGIKAISIGSMVPDGKAIVWRGAMLMKAITQIASNVIWGELDILYVDLPPGTGDVHLTLSQKIAIHGAVVVSTPQDLALLDARKAIDMFVRSDIPVLGLVENMSGYTCTNCGHHEDIFGTGGVEAEAKKFNVPVLGRIPLNMSFRLAGDAGVPDQAQSQSEQMKILYGDIHKNVFEAFKL